MRGDPVTADARQFLALLAASDEVREAISASFSTPPTH